MWIEIKFDKVYDIYIQHGCCDIKIHGEKVRFFNEIIYCYHNTEKMKIKIKQICRRLDRRFVG